MNRRPSYQESNVIFRALDTIHQPDNFSVLQCIHGIRVLMDYQNYRHWIREIPTMTQLRDRLETLERRTTNTQCVREIHDTFISNDIRPHTYNRILTHPTPPPKTVLQAIHSDRENVHNSSINTSTKQIMKHLCSDYTTSFAVEYIQTQLKRHAKWSDVCLDVLEFIEHTPTTFGIGITLKQLLCSVWGWIRAQHVSQHSELQGRLIEELMDMSGLCSTGHAARLVNVLQGYTTNKRYILSVDIQHEIQRTIKTSINTYLSKAPEHIVDGILEKTPEYIQHVTEYIRKKHPEWVQRYGLEMEEFVRQISNEYL